MKPEYTREPQKEIDLSDNIRYTATFDTYKLHSQTDGVMLKHMTLLEWIEHANKMFIDKLSDDLFNDYKKRLNDEFDNLTGAGLDNPNEFKGLIK